MKQIINEIIEVTQAMLGEYLQSKKPDLKRYAVQLKMLCEKILGSEASEHGN